MNGSKKSTPNHRATRPIKRFSNSTTETAPEWEAPIASILLTGTGGLLGRRLAHSISGHHKIFFHYHHPPESSTNTNIAGGDLGNSDYVRKLGDDIAPDIIINSAAMANVDRCETDPELSQKINVDAVQNLVRAFPDAKMVQVSTDYVFGDDAERGSRPPKPVDPTGPINTYGKHKLEAERITLDASADNLVIRVNTLFDHTIERNFLVYVYENLKAGKKIKCVDDQISNPISGYATAELITQLMENNAAGIYHLGGSEFISRYQLACRIAKAFDLDGTLIEPIATDKLPRPAARLLSAGLDCDSTEKFLKTSMPDIDVELLRIRDEMQ